MRGQSTNTNQTRTTRQKQNKNPHKQTKNKTRHNPKTARSVISWSVHSHLKRIRRDEKHCITPWDWYGKIKPERTTNHENAIQQSVSQEATKAQCGNRGSPRGASRSQSASRCAGNILTNYFDTIQKPARHCHVAKGKFEIEHSETWCENGSKVK